MDALLKRSFAVEAGLDKAGLKREEVRLRTYNQLQGL